MTDCVATLLKFPSRRNRSWTSGRREKMAMTRIRPRNGPRMFSALWKCDLLFAIAAFPSAGVRPADCGAGHQALPGPSGPLPDVDDRAAMEDDDAVADAEELGKIGTDEKDGLPLPGELADELIDLAR
jgi:hypothetical protein